MTDRTAAALTAPTFPWSADPSIAPQQAVHTSCAALEPQCTDVTINRTALRRYTLSLSPFPPPTPRPFPLRFSLSSSINFHCLLSFLQFGSGYRTLLHSLTSRGASDTVTYGVIGIFLSQNAITADYLANLSVAGVADVFRLPIHEEFEVQKAVYSERPNGLYPLADDIRRVCNECGAVLRSLQCNDFAEFVLRSYMPHTPQGPESAASLLTRLITHFPSLRDQYVLSPSSSVYLFKRAQLLVYELALHHSPAFPAGASPKSELLAYDVDSLSAFADNVLPCVLHAEGVLEYSERLAGMIDRGEEVRDERLQAELRGMSVVAVDEMVALWNEQLTTGNGEGEVKESKDGMERMSAAQMDCWLWSVAGKEERMRQRPRHASRHTVFY